MSETKTIKVYWSHLNHFEGTLDIPVGMDDEDTYKYIRDNIPYDTSASIDGGIPEKVYISWNDQQV